MEALSVPRTLGSDRISGGGQSPSWLSHSWEAPSCVLPDLLQGIWEDFVLGESITSHIHRGGGEAGGSSGSGREGEEEGEEDREMDNNAFIVTI